MLFSTSDLGDYFEVGGVDTSKVWIINNGGSTEMWYEDGDDDVNASTAGGEECTIKIDDDEITVVTPGDISDAVNYSDYTTAFNMSFEGSDDGLY